MTKDTLVICTRNRPLDLRRCLESIVQLRGFPQFVYVVDSSTDNQSLELVNKYRSQIKAKEVKYFRSEERGLVAARNVAIENLPLDCDVIHFVDDDTELGADYILEINRALENLGPDVVGAGGKIIGSVKGPTNKLLTALMLDGETLGAVLPSGVNIGSYEASEKFYMDWLPGCSMSFSTQAIRGIKFDERRAVWPLGEDVDFCLRIGERGKLVFVPGAEIAHHLSPINRDEETEILFQDTIHRFGLSKDKLGKVRFFWVLYSSMSRLSLNMLQYVRTRDRIFLERAWSVGRGMWISIFRGGLMASVGLRD